MSLGFRIGRGTIALGFLTGHEICVENIYTENNANSAKKKITNTAGMDEGFLSG